MNQRDEIEIDLRELFIVLRKRFLIILLTALIFAGGAGVYSFFIASPVYESTARLYILSQSTSITSFADIQVGSSLAVDYMELIKSRPVLDQVRDKLNLGMDNDELLGMLTVENPSDTRILNIKIQGVEKRETTQIANAFADIAKRQISEIMQTDEPTVVEVAVVPDKPIKPEKAKNIVIGFILGVLLSAFVIIVIYVVNDNIRTQEDVENYLGLNTLALIPFESDKKTRTQKKSDKKSGKAKGGRK